MDTTLRPASAVAADLRRALDNGAGEAKLLALAGEAREFTAELFEDVSRLGAPIAACPAMNTRWFLMLAEKAQSDLSRLRSVLGVGFRAGTMPSSADVVDAIGRKLVAAARSSEDLGAGATLDYFEDTMLVFTRALAASDDDRVARASVIAHWRERGGPDVFGIAASRAAAPARILTMHGEWPSPGIRRSVLRRARWDRTLAGHPEVRGLVRRWAEAGLCRPTVLLAHPREEDFAQAFDAYRTADLLSDPDLPAVLLRAPSSLLARLGQDRLARLLQHPQRLVRLKAMTAIRHFD